MSERLYCDRCKLETSLTGALRIDCLARGLETTHGFLLVMRGRTPPHCR
jgi:hypothetical protein